MGHPGPARDQAVESQHGLKMGRDRPGNEKIPTRARHSSPASPTRIDPLRRRYPVRRRATLTPAGLLARGSRLYEDRPRAHSAFPGCPSGTLEWSLSAYSCGGSRGMVDHCLGMIDAPRSLLSLDEGPVLAVFRPKDRQIATVSNPVDSNRPSVPCQGRAPTICYPIPAWPGWLTGNPGVRTAPIGARGTSMSREPCRHEDSL